MDKFNQTSNASNIDIYSIEDGLMEFIDKHAEELKYAKNYKEKADILAKGLKDATPPDLMRNVKTGVKQIKNEWNKAKIRYEAATFFTMMILIIIAMTIILCIYEFYEVEGKTVSLKTFLYFLTAVVTGVILTIVMISDNSLYKLGQAITNKKTFLGGADDDDDDDDDELKKVKKSKKSKKSKEVEREPLDDDTYEKGIMEGTKRVLSFQEKTYMTNGILFGIFLFVVLVIIAIVGLELLGDGLNYDMGSGFKVKYLVYPLGTLVLGALIGGLAVGLHWIPKLGGRASKSMLMKKMVDMVDQQAANSPISVKDSYDLYLKTAKELEYRANIDNDTSVDIMMYWLNK